MPDDCVTTASQLRETYKEPVGTSVKKELDHLDKHCRAFMALSPFCVLAPSAMIVVRGIGGPFEA